MLKQNLSESQFFASITSESSIGCSIVLSVEESNHAIKVFRHRTGDLLQIGNGKGVQGIGKIINANADTCTLQLESIAAPVPKPRLHLAIACLKDNDLEQVMDDCGQLELASITLLRTDHSQEPKNSDLGRTIRRLEMKSMTAFKQSQKSWITNVYGPIPFTQWLAECPQVILCDIDGSNSLPPNVLSATSPDLSLAVGPEGGFSQSEIAAMKDKNALLLKLGTTRLRARTCPAIAMGALIGMGLQQS